MRSFALASLLRIGSASAIGLLAAGSAGAQSLTSLGFTYQGQLRSAGGLVSAACDLQFSLWDASDLGTMLGVAEEHLAVPVSQGRFSVQLNTAAQFGADALNGQARWLRIDVRCPGDPGYTMLSPRQALAGSPAALAIPGVVPGPFATGGNRAGNYSVAAGRRAKATNTGAFVWADSTNADFTSTADNQASFRAANGVFIASDAGGAKAVPVGTRYRDNAVIAWARVTAVGNLDSNFNVQSVSHVGAGHYQITLASPVSSGFSLVPVVTPEIDPIDAMGTPPTGAANVRIPATNQVAAGTVFDVYIYNGNFTTVDNDFQVMVTGR